MHAPYIYRNMHVCSYITLSEACIDTYITCCIKVAPDTWKDQPWPGGPTSHLACTTHMCLLPPHIMNVWNMCKQEGAPTECMTKSFFDPRQLSSTRVNHAKASRLPLALQTGIELPSCKSLTISAPIALSRWELLPQYFPPKDKTWLFPPNLALIPMELFL